ncbi:MAG TPA: FAD-dependent oxidoreductase [Candidatus Paceibacterota bacterium]
MKTQTSRPKIVVVGGGFAGVEAVHAILKSRVPATVTLISNREYLTYYPALYSLVTDGVQSEVAFPLADLFPEGSVHLMNAIFTSVDQARQVIALQTEKGESELPYDYLVLALGSQASYFNIPGLKECSLSFKSVDEALRLKGHFETTLAKAKTLPKNEQVALLHTVVVGGGPSGVELAGTLKDYLTKRARVHSIDPSLITIDIIEGSPRLLPTMSEKVSKLAEDRLRTLGVNIFTNRVLQSEDRQEVILNDMDIQSGSVVWTAGTSISETYLKIPGLTQSDRRRIVVTENLTLPNDNHIFIAGDGAATEFSGLAQTAIHDGKYVGRAIVRMIKGKEVDAYVPQKPSYVVPIGKRWAIFVHRGLVFKGILPSILRRFIDWQYRFSVYKK